MEARQLDPHDKARRRRAPEAKLGRYPKHIRERAFSFSVRIIQMARELPRDAVGRIVGAQVVRSGTSVGANLEEAQGADSKKEFLRSVRIAKREARETLYWLRLLAETQMLPERRLSALIDEADKSSPSYIPSYVRARTDYQAVGARRLERGVSCIHCSRQSVLPRSSA